jgi:hypothetical protein
MKTSETEAFLPGILTPEEIISAHFSRMGKKGAASQSEKLRLARSRNAKTALKVRMANLKWARQS